MIADWKPPPVTDHLPKPYTTLPLRHLLDSHTTAMAHKMDRSFLEASIPKLVKELTVDEKLSLLAAVNWWE